MYVVLLGLLGFWEVSVHIVYVEQCTGDVVTVPDALDSCCFGGKHCGCMEVLDCVCQAWEIIHAVYISPLLLGWN